MKAIYFEEPSGLTVVEDDIPDHMMELAKEKRQELIGMFLYIDLHFLYRKNPKKL